MILKNGVGSFFSKRCSHSFRDFLTDLDARSLIKSTYPNDLQNKWQTDLSNLSPVAYAGFDPTADSLHVGNLVVLTNLLRAAQHGIKPIVIIGGYTARVGDPSGRTTERDEIDDSIVDKNTSALTSQVQQIFEHASTSADPIIVNNMQWYGGSGMYDFITKYTRPMQVTKMLRMGAIKSRIENGISLPEFNYQAMQAYDWYKLMEKFDCRFQMGGSDQLGHLDFGAHYIKRKANTFAAGVCLPLLTDSAGNKIGKSIGGGSLWLAAHKTSPYHFYQFFSQMHDDEADRLLLQLSLKPLEEVTEILKEHRQNLGKWVAQKAMAKEVTRYVHGKSGLEMALKCTEALFGAKKADLSKLTRDEILQVFGNHLDVDSAETHTMGVLADRTRKGKPVGSILMQKGAFSVNGIKKLNPTEPLDKKDVVLPNASDLTLVCWGKRDYQLVRWLS